MPARKYNDSYPVGSPRAYLSFLTAFYFIYAPLYIKREYIQRDKREKISSTTIYKRFARETSNQKIQEDSVARYTLTKSYNVSEFESYSVLLIIAFLV